MPISKRIMITYENISWEVQLKCKKKNEYTQIQINVHTRTYFKEGRENQVRIWNEWSIETEKNQFSSSNKKLDPLDNIVWFSDEKK